MPVGFLEGGCEESIVDVNGGRVLLFCTSAAVAESDIDFSAEASKASFEKRGRAMINVKVHNN